MRHTTADVLIIGGGVIGTSIAYYLSCREIRVILLDKGELAGGTSGACDGLIFLQSKKPGLHLRLALTSQQLYAELAEALPRGIAYRNTGGLVVMENESDIESMQAHVQQQQVNGLDVRLLDRQQLLDIEPCLSPELFGAAFSPLDSQVDPIALTQALALGAQMRGARLCPRTEVLGITRTRDRVDAVQTRQERFQAGWVINAAGVWAPAINQMLGLRLPIIPRRGQILVSEPLPPLLGKCLLSARYMSAKYQAATLDAGQQNGGVSMEQSERGNLLLGSTREFVGFDRRTTLNGLQTIARSAAGIIPALRDVQVIRSFAGLRPYTPDGLPVLGRVSECPGLLMAAGHEGDGIALAPVTGLLIAELIADGAESLPLEAFSFDRFVEYTAGEHSP